MGKGKEKTEESRNLELQAYYSGLRKKERSMLLAYLMTTFGYRYSTLVAKFSSRPLQSFNLRDLALIEPVVNTGEWRL